jgi:hypothetical protein
MYGEATFVLAYTIYTEVKTTILSTNFHTIYYERLQDGIDVSCRCKIYGFLLLTNLSALFIDYAFDLTSINAF